mmetsp:Transcript_30507/g.93277  ORF Transcript_30507/g.93277 Transcript_30507/m.93277 type:complete len:164 (-) Transcript_30507:1293-1784(-)|eukprot:scaffold75203_cov33-Tisochrysis_lutea.AAC.2
MLPAAGALQRDLCDEQLWLMCSHNHQLTLSRDFLLSKKVLLSQQGKLSSTNPLISVFEMRCRDADAPRAPILTSSQHVTSPSPWLIPACNLSFVPPTIRKLSPDLFPLASGTPAPEYFLANKWPPSQSTLRLSTSPPLPSRSTQRNLVCAYESHAATTTKYKS